MRICLISREYPPETGWGGIATFTRHLAHGLKEIGHDVVVVSLSKDEDKLVDDDGIPVHRVKQEWLGKRLGTISLCMPYSRYVLMTSTALWRKFFLLHSEQPFDVVDTPELLAEGFFPSITKALPLLIRLYTPHSKFIAERLHNVTPSFDHEFVAGVERIAMLGASVLSSPSRDLAEFVANDLNYDVEDIHIVRNPISASEFSDEGIKHLASDQGKMRVLFVGRLEERKGIHYLVKAIPEIVMRHKNVEFVIIGDDTKNASGQKSVLDELKAIIAKHEIKQYVTFIPRVPLTDLPGYYRSADICVIPSVYDNSPYTCLEAMSCGRPVVATTGGGTAEYFVNGESGIAVAPKDENALASAINRLLQDTEYRLQIGRNARKHVLANFDRKVVADQTCQLYKLAQQRHAERSRSQFYIKPPAKVLQDTVFMLSAFDTMIYDTLYQYSWRFRAIHWYRIMRYRPRLFLAKTTLKFTGLLGSATGHKIGSLNKFETWLKTETASKQIDPGLTI